MEKNQNKKGFKKIILLLLLFVGFGAAITAGAYWASSTTIKVPVAQQGAYKVTIGKGAEQSVDSKIVLTPDQGALADKNLVPTGYEHGTYAQAQVGDVNKVSFTVTVAWGYLEASPTYEWAGTGTLTASFVGTSIVDSADAVKIDDASSMFDVTITPNTDQTITFGGDVEYTVTVTFANEPDSEAQYDLVAENFVAVTLSFAISTPVATP